MTHPYPPPVEVRLAPYPPAIPEQGHKEYGPPPSDEIGPYPPPAPISHYGH